MSAAIEIIELEPLALSPAVAARYLSISKRGISRCFAESLLRVAAEKDRPSADCIRPPRSCGTTAAQPDPSLMI
jgi:hypothetical protein